MRDIEGKAAREAVSECGQRASFKGSNRFRARVGDYRIIYTFDLDQNKIHLLAIRQAGLRFALSVPRVHERPLPLTHFNCRG